MQCTVGSWWCRLKVHRNSHCGQKALPRILQIQHALFPRMSGSIWPGFAGWLAG